MTPKQRALTREALIACGQNSSKASDANPWTKKGLVAATVQEWIGRRDPVEAANMRLEANPAGLTLDAQCVLDGTLHPDQVGAEVMQNLFEYNSRFAKKLINNQTVQADERIASGNATFTDRIQMEDSEDPRLAAIKEKDAADKKRAKQDRETINGAMLMQSRERARQELIAMNGGMS